MKPLNLIDIETPWGYRSFELHHRDLTELDFKVDVLAVSAFSKNYEPVPNTVIGALHDKCQIDMKALAEDPEYDLVDAFGCWVAKTVPDTKFDRIVCVESFDEDAQLGEVLENLFIVLSILGLKGISVETLALPILGAGNQGLEPEMVIKALLNCSLKYLNHSPNTRRILFVEISEERAHKLDEAMNDVLDRVKLVIPKGELYKGLRNDIANSLKRGRTMVGDAGYAFFGDAIRLIESDQIRSFEIGMIARRIIECIVNDFLRGRKSPFELDKIDALSQLGVAGWITSYLHVLRIFGNESAHEKDKPNRKPASINEADMALCLFCLQRVLDFWLENKPKG
jgi:hypothetical protein